MTSSHRTASFCATHGLARQKAPKQIEIVGPLPRNAAGKVLEHELRAAVAPGRPDASTTA